MLTTYRLILIQVDKLSHNSYAEIVNLVIMNSRYFSFYIILRACARTRAFYTFSFSSITSVTIMVKYLIIRVLNGDRRVIEGVIEVIEERFVNCK